MDPSLIIAGGIQGIGQLASGLFNLKAQEKERKRATLMGGLEAEMAAKQAAAQGLQQGTQSAFNQLMANYTNVFRR
jgi:hypothetical protein